MKKFFEKLGVKIQTSMQGRYGTDELSHFIFITGLVIILLSFFISSLSFLYTVALVLLIWSWYRSMSRNISKRQNERNRYLKIKLTIKQKFTLLKNMWSDRKTHRYYKCPRCKALVRIKKPGRGRNIIIACPKCNNQFEKRT